MSLNDSKPYNLATCSLPLFKLNFSNYDKDKDNYIRDGDLFTNVVKKHFLAIKDNMYFLIIWKLQNTNLAKTLHKYNF